MQYERELEFARRIAMAAGANAKDIRARGVSAGVWDLAALKLIIEEAGGDSFALDGSRRVDRGTAIGCAPSVSAHVREKFGIPPA